MDLLHHRFTVAEQLLEVRGQLAVGPTKTVASQRTVTLPTVAAEALAEHLGTSVRFVRRLVFERRIAYVKVGRHVRISEHDLSNYVATARVEADRRLGA